MYAREDARVIHRLPMRSKGFQPVVDAGCLQPFIHAAKAEPAALMRWRLLVCCTIAVAFRIPGRYARGCWIGLSKLPPSQR